MSQPQELQRNQDRLSSPLHQQLMRTEPAIRTSPQNPEKSGSPFLEEPGRETGGAHTPSHLDLRPLPSLTPTGRTLSAATPDSHRPHTLRCQASLPLQAHTLCSHTLSAGTQRTPHRSLTLMSSRMRTTGGATKYTCTASWFNAATYGTRQ